MLRPQLLCEISQKRSSVNFINHKNGYIFIRFCEQCERTKTAIFLAVFVQKRSSVNGCWISTKTDKFENGAV